MSMHFWEGRKEVELAAHNIRNLKRYNVFVLKYLDHGDGGLEVSSELLHDLGEERLVLHHLPHFHRSNDAGLNEMVTVLLNAGQRLLLFPPNLRPKRLVEVESDLFVLVVQEEVNPRFRCQG
jgi:hypothetical protein